MKKIWFTFGQIAFWLSWPLLFIYLRIGKRTRVVIAFEEEILLVRGWLSDGKWSLPGGGVHKGEDSVQGAIREIREETGISLQPSQLRYIGDSVANNKGLKFHYDQYGVKLNKRPSVVPQRTEIITTAWVNQKDVNNSNAEQTTINTLELWKMVG